MKTNVQSFLLTTFFIFLTSCATYQHDTIFSSRTVSYQEVIDYLSASLVSKIKALGEQKKLILIYNANIVNGEETKLENRFIQDLEDELSNMNISIKRKEILNNDKNKIRPLKIECNKDQIKYESDFFIALRINECIQGPECLIAAVRLVNKKLDTVIFSDKKTLKLTDNIKKWNQERLPLKKVKGIKENPYKDFQEAARCMLKQIACIAKSIIKSKDLMIFIKGTDETSEDLIVSFGQSSSQFGIKHALSSEKWIDVALGTKDQFKRNIYDKNYQHHLFQTTQLVLGLDMKNIDHRISEIRAQLLTIDQVDITISEISETINPGMAIPLCAATGYVLSTDSGKNISAIGIGSCSKNKYSAGMWENSAKKAAKLDALSQLTEKVRSNIVHSKKVVNAQLKNEIITSSVNASINHAKLLWEQFDPDECIAKAKYEIQTGDIIIHSTSTSKSFEKSKNPFDQTINKRPPIKGQYSIASKTNLFGQNTNQTYSVKKAYERGQNNMIRFVQSHIRKLMKKDKIEPRIGNKISISGNIDLVNCRIENHYLAPKNIPPRNYCTVNYNLILKLNVKENYLFETHDQIEGMGPDRNIAWEDALLGIAENIYPLIRDIAFTISFKTTIESLRNTLQQLQVWNINSDYDMDSLLKEISNFLDEVSNTYN